MSEEINKHPLPIIPATHGWFYVFFIEEDASFSAWPVLAWVFAALDEVRINGERRTVRRAVYDAENDFVCGRALTVPWGDGDDFVKGESVIIFAFLPELYNRPPDGYGQGRPYWILPKESNFGERGAK